MMATAPSAPTVMMTAWVAVGHSFMWARLALALSGMTETVPGVSGESIS